MKWIGQHIYDLVARFRNDVYLEDISTGTIASGGNLGLDSNNKIVKATSSGGISFDGSTADGILTYKDSDEATVESNLTFNGSRLSLTGNLAAVGDSFTFTSATENAPIVEIKTTHTTINAESELRFTKDAADTEDNESLGMITFYGEDEGNNLQKFAHIRSKIAESDEGSEGGNLFFAIASHDGEMVNGLTIKDGNLEDEIDVTIASGAASVTTIAGTLTMGSTAAMTNAGLLSVANQSNVTGVGTISSGVWNGTAIASAYIADDAVTFAKASGVTPKIYGSVIKLIPSDFMDNGDGGNTKFGVAYTDVAGTGYGMRPPNNATELYAFVSIPEGMKATHVDIYDKNDLAIEVFECQINATTMTSKGSGNCNTTLDITDVNSTATNFLAIEVTTTSVNDRVYGGQVTIAAQ
jgi:hypothetical protein